MFNVTSCFAGKLPSEYSIISSPKPDREHFNHHRDFHCQNEKAPDPRHFQQADDPVKCTVRDDTDTEVGSAVLTPAIAKARDILLASLKDRARALARSLKFYHKAIITASSFVALVRLGFHFVGLDNAIRLYDSFVPRFIRPSNS